MADATIPVTLDPQAVAEAIDTQLSRRVEALEAALAIHHKPVYVYRPDPDHPGALQIAFALREATAEFKTGHTGSRPYLSGTVRARRRDEGRITCDADIIDNFPRDHDPLWVMADEPCGRLRVARVQNWQISGGELILSCSQLAPYPIEFARIDGRNHGLILVEPDMPTPVENWLPAERARAIRDLCAHWPARPTSIQVLRDARMVEFDPWAPEYLTDYTGEETDQ